MIEGRVLSQRPPVRGALGRGLDWAGMVEFLREHPGEDVLFDDLTGLPNVVSVYQTVKSRSHPDLRLDDGWVVRGHVRNSRRSIDNPTRRVGNLILVLVKEGDTE